MTGVTADWDQRFAKKYNKREKKNCWFYERDFEEDI